MPATEAMAPGEKDTLVPVLQLNPPLLSQPTQTHGGWRAPSEWEAQLMQWQWHVAGVAAAAAWGC